MLRLFSAVLGALHNQNDPSDLGQHGATKVTQVWSQWAVERNMMILMGPKLHHSAVTWYLSCIGQALFKKKKKKLR